MTPFVIVIALELLAILKLVKLVSQAQSQSLTSLRVKSIGLVLLILGLPIFLVFCRHW